ncbi:MAG: BGTF surface domain-containing protein, partial [Halohasta sp.]
GDFVEVSVSTGDVGEGYVMLGGDQDADGENFENYLDILHVEGDATFIINTRLVGSDRPTEDVYIPVDGEVSSYAHGIGADSEPKDEFEGLTFENDGGGEIASTLAEFRDEQGISQRASPIQPGRFQLVAGRGPVIDRADDVPDFGQSLAKSNLVLTPPEVGDDVTIYTLPPSSADRVDQFDEGGEAIGSGDIGTLLGEATETDQIARGDRILIEVQASGMYGALFDDEAVEQAAIADGEDEHISTGQMNRLLSRHEGVRVELDDEELSQPNNPGSELQFEGVASSDLRILPDDSADQWEDADALGTDPLVGGFYIVIDTRGDDPFDNQPKDGDELRFDFAYESPPDSNYEYEEYAFEDGAQPDPFDPGVDEVDGLEHFPYYGPSDTTEGANASFVFEEPSLEYGETTLENELIVPAEEDGVITGQTNIAPGSQAEMELVSSDRPSPETITIEDIEIDEDRRFEVSEDFSELEPGDRVEVEFYTTGRLDDNQLIDRRGVRVVDDLDNPSNFEISEFSDDVEVERGKRLDDIAATINNTGDVADRQLVEFRIDGEPVRNESIVLESGEDKELDLSGEFVVLSPGEYDYTVETEDDEESGTLTVTGSDDTEISSSDSDSPTENSTPAEDEGDDDGGDDGGEESGLFGMVGLRSRDVAVAAAVTGAMHVLGQWT